MEARHLTGALPHHLDIGPPKPGAPWMGYWYVNGVLRMKFRVANMPRPLTRSTATTRRIELMPCSDHGYGLPSGPYRCRLLTKAFAASLGVEYPAYSIEPTGPQHGYTSDCANIIVHGPMLKATAGCALSDGCVIPLEDDGCTPRSLNILGGPAVFSLHVHRVSSFLGDVARPPLRPDLITAVGRARAGDSGPSKWAIALAVGLLCLSALAILGTEVFLGIANASRGENDAGDGIEIGVTAEATKANVERAIAQARRDQDTWGRLVLSRVEAMPGEVKKALIGYAKTRTPPDSIITFPVKKKNRPNQIVDLEVGWMLSEAQRNGDKTDLEGSLAGVVEQITSITPPTSIFEERPS